MINLSEMKAETERAEAVDKAPCLLAAAPSGQQAKWVAWLLEILDARTDDTNAFNEVLRTVRESIATRLEIGYW